MRKNFYLKLIFLFSFLFLLCSCKTKSAADKQRFHLTYGWTYSTIGEPAEFLPLPDNDLYHISHLLENRTGYIFLKNEFSIPQYFKHKDISIFLGRLKIASKLYLNGHLLGESGFFPPHEFTEGERSIYYKIPKEYINFSDKNTIMLCIWCHDYGTIKSTPFISTTTDITNKAEFDNLIYSKIYLVFSAILIIVFLIYIFLFLLRRSEIANMSFAFLCLSTAFYLVVFYIGEYSVIYNGKYSLLLFEKIFNGAAPLLTCYYIICFTRDFLGYKEKTSRKATRIIITVLCLVSIFLGTDIVAFRLILRFCFTTMIFLFIYPTRIIIQSFKKKDSRVYYFILCFIPIYLSLLVQVFSTLVLKRNVNSLMLAVSWILVIFLFLGMLIMNFVNLSKEIEYINKNLEHLVQVRTDSLEQEKERAIREIKLASFVQQNFFKIDSTVIDKWDLQYYSKPMAGVSGDMYIAFNPDNKLDGFGIFDVSGHGIASGLVTMLVKNIIEQEFYRGLKKPLADVMNLINNRIIKEKGYIENYLTGILIRIKKDKIELVNAGHPKALLYSKKNDSVNVIEQEGVNQYGTIGIDGMPVNFQVLTFEMNSGDELILYTDGITEAQNPEGKYFGTAGIIEYFNKHKKEDLAFQVEEINPALADYVGSENFNDDITYVILRKK